MWERMLDFGLDVVLDIVVPKNRHLTSYGYRGWKWLEILQKLLIIYTARRSFTGMLESLKTIAFGLSTFLRAQLNPSKRRDLKPDNLGFNSNNELKLFDFGLAKRLTPEIATDNDLYLLTGNTGSLRYMAPEVRSWNTGLWMVLYVKRRSHAVSCQIFCHSNLL